MQPDRRGKYQREVQHHPSAGGDPPRAQWDVSPPTWEHPQSSPSLPPSLTPYPSPAHAAPGLSLPPCTLLARATPGPAAEMKVQSIFSLRAALRVYSTSHPEGTQVLYRPSITIIHLLLRSSGKRSSHSVLLTPRDTLPEEGQK